LAGESEGKILTRPLLRAGTDMKDSDAARLMGRKALI
jgi:hypothetical protein